MKELISIQVQEGKQAVSARELYNFLEVKTEFARWCSRMFEYGFEEGRDFSSFLTKTLNGRPSIDYILSIDTAKEISMIQRSEKGKIARQYFLECEKKLMEQRKPMSILDTLEMSIKQLREQEQKLQVIESDITELKAITKTRPDYFTVVGYATLNKMSIGLQLASRVGQKAAMYCKRNGLLTEEIPDPRFGKVRMYPKEVLDEIFSMEIAQIR
jgi:phage anti-repressor protein